MRTQMLTQCSFSCIVFSLLCFDVGPIAAQDVYLCVWRNPERTMTKIFPDAVDYRTVNEKIAPAQRERIERELGFALLPGQREQFQYFEMLGTKGIRIGTIIAASQKGEYGAIEFVFGFDHAGVIKGIYVQRSREKDQRFKDRAFLDLFVGKKRGDKKRLKSLHTGTPSSGTTAVINGLIKELTVYETLVSGNTGTVPSR